MGIGSLSRSSSVRERQGKVGQGRVGHLREREARARQGRAMTHFDRSDNRSVGALIFPLFADLYNPGADWDV